VAHVLVVEDSPVQAKHIDFILREAGYEVETVPHGIAALLSIRRRIPSAVITDMHMPEMNGLDLVQTLRTEFPNIPVIMTTDRGTEELAVQALRAGASSYIPKRNLARDAVPILEEILSVTASQQKRSEFLSRMTTAEYRFTLENNPDLIAQVVQQVETLLTSMQLFDESEQLRIGMAVHEATVNAMVHGNLEVSSELKLGDWDAYHDMIAKRAKERPYSERRVYVTIRGDRSGSLEIRVLDEGRGYDPRSLPDPTEADNLGLSCGRGLLLIRTFFDEVRFNPKGTEIIMVKRRKASA